MSVKKEMLKAPKPPNKKLEDFCIKHNLYSIQSDAIYGEKTTHCTDLETISKTIPSNVSLKDVKIELVQMGEDYYDEDNDTNIYENTANVEIYYLELQESPEYSSWLKENKEYQKKLQDYNTAKKEQEIVKLENKLKKLKGGTA